MLRRLLPGMLAVGSLATALTHPAQAQTATMLAPRPAPEVTLTLDQALEQARSSSPAYRQATNELVPARTNVDAAYGQLTPSFGASLGAGYTGAGQSQFGAFFGRTSPYISSNFSLAFNWTLNGRALVAPAQLKAIKRAVGKDLDQASLQLRSDVTQQYLITLQATAQVAVARKQVERNTDFLALAQARYRVGQANLLDVRQAEVTKGNSEVALLQALQTENEAKLELYRRMGVLPPAMVDRIALTDSFPIERLPYEMDALLRMALGENPAIAALRLRAESARLGVKAAKSDYLPTLSATAGWSGFTQQFTDKSLLLNNRLASAQGSLAQCPYTNTAIGLGVTPGPTLDCSPGAYGLTSDGLGLTPAAQQAVLDPNSTFPFKFTAQPFQASLRISIPIWDGLSRRYTVARAQADRRNADEATRARELLVQTNVTSRYLALATALETIQIQGRNRDAARDQLQLAQDRYRIGSGTSLELADAQNNVSLAEGNYVNAVYSYHIAVAALELAVGRPLR